MIENIRVIRGVSSVDELFYYLFYCYFYGIQIGFNDPRLTPEGLAIGK